MRDASIEDIVAAWIARVMERADWAPQSDAYLAIIRHSAINYINHYQQLRTWSEAAPRLEDELKELLSILPKSPDDRFVPEDYGPWMIPMGISLSKNHPDRFKQRHAYYWTTNEWKSDFLSALEDQFWTYRDYAHAAGKGKMVFLRELAEVWVAAATTALVLYADNDKATWRKTANMLRRHADMVEADGLRALPWGQWGYLHDRVPAKAEPEAGET